MRAANGYSEDSNSLYARFPWMTLVDERISVEAWTMGAAWAYRNVRSESVSLEQEASLCDDYRNILLYNKLNWRWNRISKDTSTVNVPVVPEESRRDQQSPLPSQELPTLFMGVNDRSV
jgi:hypothetical protein